MVIWHPSQRLFTFGKEYLIAKNRNTYAKFQREQEKRQRADDKRNKRERKVGGPVQSDGLGGSPQPNLQPKSSLNPEESAESGLSE